MRQRVSEVQQILSKVQTDEFNTSNRPQVQNEQILHSKIARFININPSSFPYGKMNYGKSLLKQDEDPWINLRPQTTDQKSRLLYQKEIQSIIYFDKNIKKISQKANPQVVKMRSKSLNHTGQTKIKSFTIDKINKNGDTLKNNQNNEKKKQQEKILLVESAVYPQIYFSKNPEQVPFSKCCNSPIQVDLQESGVGKYYKISQLKFIEYYYKGMIVCNNPGCQANILVQFLISFDDAVKLWKQKLIFKHASQRDNQMRQRISNMVSNGKFRYYSLKKEIDKTSKEISQIFTNQQLYESNRNQQYEYNLQQDKVRGIKNKKISYNQRNHQNDENYNQNDLFMTNIINQSKNMNNDKILDILEEDDENNDLDQIEQISCNIEKEFMQQSQLQSFKQKLSESLVQNSTIFNKNFYSYFTNSNNEEILFKPNTKAKMVRKQRLVQSSQQTKRQALKPQQPTQSQTIQNNFMLQYYNDVQSNDFQS